MSGKPTDNAFCHCTDLRPVCGDNKRTYSNKCQLFEETSGRRETVQIVRYEPCDEGEHRCGESIIEANDS